MRKLVLLLSTFFILLPNYSFAIDFSKGNNAKLLSERSGWHPTGANNSLEKDRTIFQFTKRGNKRELNTDSESTNIHNHFKRGGAGRLKNYLYRGQMKIDDENAGIGVTFYSKFPKEDAYYRLRRYGGNSFHIAPHPDGKELTEGSLDTGVTPEVGQWYNFKVLIKTSRRRTTLRAKVWAASDRQPRLWQVIVIDENSDRVKRGKPGVWSMGPGLKSWRKLIVKAR